MTVMEVIREFDGVVSNGFSLEQKIRWVDRLDGFIQKTVLDRYPRRKADFLGGDPERAVLMEEPFGEAYIHWLAAKVSYFNQETERYNSSAGLFRGLFEDWQRELHRKEAPENPGGFRL